MLGGAKSVPLVISKQWPLFHEGIGDKTAPSGIGMPF
jgi:hypothetical protein